jgi:uncharacterized glyoxalase superfamily protein PhnB
MRKQLGSLLTSFNCHHHMFMYLQYITEDAVCFYSNLFGKETRKILPFDRMTSINKRTAAYVIPTLEFVMHPTGRR